MKRSLPLLIYATRTLALQKPSADCMEQQEAQIQNCDNHLFIKEITYDQFRCKKVQENIFSKLESKIRMLDHESIVLKIKIELHIIQNKNYYKKLKVRKIVAINNQSLIIIIFFFLSIATSTE